MNENIPDEKSVPPSGADQSARTSSEYTFNQFLKDIGDIAVKVAVAASKAAEDVSGLVVVPVDSETREDLDMLVDTGLAKNRAKAVLYLVRDGIKSNQSIYAHVEQTREQIKALRSQLKSTAGQS
jgi:hypothetical protein